MNYLSLVENKNIKADRFAMAAISYIFKAFGDPVRSKEYWPWGETVNIPWEEPKQFLEDISMGRNMLTEAIKRHNEEVSNDVDENDQTPMLDYNDMTTKNYKRKLNQIILNLKSKNKTSKNIDNTSNETKIRIKDTKDRFNIE